jgi:anthranilate synthase component 1
VTTGSETWRISSNGIISGTVDMVVPAKASVRPMTAAMFPAGTVSGAPKPRAMEIIEELEPVRRGPYAGALGYFSFNGNADFAITIRTLVARGSKCSIQSGAGIVADSDPEKEWHETESKAAGLMKAVERVTGRRLIGEGRR